MPASAALIAASVPLNSTLASPVPSPFVKDNPPSVLKVTVPLVADLRHRMPGVVDVRDADLITVARAENQRYVLIDRLRSRHRVDRRVIRPGEGDRHHLGGAVPPLPAPESSVATTLNEKVIVSPAQPGSRGSGCCCSPSCPDRPQKPATSAAASGALERHHRSTPLFRCCRPPLTVTTSVVSRSLKLSVPLSEERGRPIAFVHLAPLVSAIDSVGWSFIPVMVIVTTWGALCPRCPHRSHRSPPR